jgi:polyhydroxybutyrate depolymerase
MHPIAEAKRMICYMRIFIPLLFFTSIILAVPTFAETVDFIDNGRGQVPVYLPSDYDGSTPLPLVFSLHGYSDPDVEGYFDFVPQVDEKQFIYCIPTGTTDAFDSAFWNGTDACCDFLNTNVDDSGYLRQLIEIIQAQYAVDELSIHFTGISNGGFMTYRMACDHADLIASIAPLAGTTFLDDSNCTPSDPVHVLHIHGTADSTILYDGDCIVSNCYPGAEESIDSWRNYNGCDSVPTDGGPAFNLDWSVGGNETTGTIYQQNCNDDVTVELWTMTGSEHVPNFRRNNDPLDSNLFANTALDWLLAHRKPGGLQCPGDVDGNARVDIQDLLAVLESWGSSDAATDINLDGIVNVIDLLAIVAAWGPCP